MAREHDRDTDKERQLRRWQKAQRHLHSREEELRRKQAAKLAQASRRDRPRERGFDEDGETDAFARMRPRVAATSTGNREPPAATARGVVTAVHRNGIEIDGQPARLGADLVLDPALRPVVGDEVAFVATDGPPRAVAVLPRRTVLARPDPGNPHAALVLAANVDVAVIVVAARDPAPKPGLIDRCLVAVARGGIAAVVCANKVDLLDAAGRAAIDALLAPYEELGIAVVRCSAASGEGIAELRERLRSRTAVFLGHSGVGKSSLLNALDPDGRRRVGDVRDHDGKGRHTTTAATLRALGDGLAVIDTPGVRAFGLAALTAAELADAFPEFAPHTTGCRHRDCSHVHEPQCGVREAVAAGRVPAARYGSYVRILAAAD